MEPFENDSSSTTTQVSSPGTALDFIRKWEVFKSFLTSAVYWFGFGFNIIPILPGNKMTSVKWDPWLDDLGSQKINEYWTANPDHELGFIVGDDIIVIDADSPESIAAIKEIEGRFGLTPKLLVKTRKGEHHYFRRAAGTVAKSDSHSTEKHPERLDIKTGRAFVVLPPSTGKIIEKIEATGKDDLSEVSQDFIDAIYIHNGRPAPSLISSEVATRSFPQEEVDDASSEKIGALLKWIDPDCGYSDWLHVGMAIFHETVGSDDGLALFDTWSSKGKKYKGIKDIELKWKSFRTDVAKPVTIATIIKMARDAGADLKGFIGDAFEPCEFETVTPTAEEYPKVDSVSPEQDTAQHSVKDEPHIGVATPEEKALQKYAPLRRYYITDLRRLEEMAKLQVLFLGKIALLGQATVMYAKQNTGKTLLILYLIIEAIKAGTLDPSRLIYINMDDNGKGLLEKARLAQEFGFQMVADGYNGFDVKEFQKSIHYMVENDKAQGVIVVLDTLKKFVNAMDKAKATEFTKDIRRFVLKGGTVIALSHVNKNPGRDGKVVYSGTTDIIDDFDCGYTLDTVPGHDESRIRTVLFENIKKRGDVAELAAFTYTTEPGVSYEELLASVQEVDPEQSAAIRQEAEIQSYGEVVATIVSCINDGINTKMLLVSEVAVRAKISRRNAIKVIEKFSGDDPEQHRWIYEVKEHGTKVFRLLERPAEQPPGPAIPTP